MSSRKTEVAGVLISHLIDTNFNFPIFCDGDGDGDYCHYRYHTYRTLVKMKTRMLDMSAKLRRLTRHAITSEEGMHTISSQIYQTIDTGCELRIDLV